MALTMQQNGMTRGDLIKMAGAQDTLYDPSSEAYGRTCAEIGRTIYEQAGRQKSAGFHYFDLLVKSASWSESLQECAVSPVHEVLVLERIKSANELINGAASVFQSGARVFPDVLKYMYGLAALGGVGAGALTWNMERDGEQGSKDVESDQAKADYYNRLTYLMDNKLKKKGLPA